MAADYFLKLDSVTGESTDSQHKDEIELTSWSWGESQTTSRGSGSSGSGAGRVNMNDFHFTMEMSAASTALALACATGKHLSKGVMTARKAGGKQEKYLVVSLDDVLVSSFQTGGHGGGEIPVESISLNFSKIKVEYFKQGVDGSTKAAGTFVYDLTANKAG